MQSKKNASYIKMIEEFIDTYIETNHTSPTTTEVSEGVGLPRSTVGRYIAYMREEGILEYEGHRSLTTSAVRSVNEVSVKVPVLGACLLYTSDAADD